MDSVPFDDPVTEVSAAHTHTHLPVIDNICSHRVSSSFVSIHVMICCESTIINNGYCFTWPGVNKILAHL